MTAEYREQLLNHIAGGYPFRFNDSEDYGARLREARLLRVPVSLMDDLSERDVTGLAEFTSRSGLVMPHDNLWVELGAVPAEGPAGELVSVRAGAHVMRAGEFLWENPVFVADSRQGIFGGRPFQTALLMSYFNDTIEPGLVSCLQFAALVSVSAAALLCHEPISRCARCSQLGQTEGCLKTPSALMPWVRAPFFVYSPDCPHPRCRELTRLSQGPIKNVLAAINYPAYLASQ